MDDYEYDESLKPISPLGYIGFQLLFALPVIGLIIAIVLSFAPKNQNVKNFARSQIVAILIVILVTIILTVVAMLMGVPVEEYVQQVQQSTPV